MTVVERTTHPTYGPALGGAPFIIDGVAFYPFRTGVNRFTRATADGSIEVRQFVNDRGRTGCSTTYWVTVNGTPLGRRFLLFRTAARAAIKAFWDARRAAS